MRRDPLLDRWGALSSYNTEVSRGIPHTAEYDERMRAEQAAFDAEHNPPCEVCRRPSVYVWKDFGGPRLVASACADCRDLVALVRS